MAPNERAGRPEHIANVVFAWTLDDRIAYQISLSSGCSWWESPRADEPPLETDRPAHRYATDRADLVSAL